MSVLRESPWYQEILEEGLERGLEQGRREGAWRQLVRVLEHRFGSVPPAVQMQLRRLDDVQLEALVDAALDAGTLEEFVQHLPPDSTNGQETDSEQSR